VAFLTQEKLQSISILLFAEIFSSSHMNSKNRQQLLKHFIVHSTPAQAIATGKKGAPAPEVGVKKFKLMAIGLTTLAIC
jgi:hypothetical protein